MYHGKLPLERAFFKWNVAQRNAIESFKSIATEQLCKHTKCKVDSWCHIKSKPHSIQKNECQKELPHSQQRRATTHRTASKRCRQKRATTHRTASNTPSKRELPHSTYTFSSFMRCLSLSRTTPRSCELREDKSI